MSAKTKERCFIITPIGDESDPIRRHIEGIIDAALTPALNDKYEIVVAHKISEPGSITKQIISEIYESKLVIANLTNRNPNVMYELALRHAIGKPVIMIAEKGTNLPSDIIMQRVIFYHNDAKGVLELKENIIDTEKEIDFVNKGGPIVDVLGDISHDTNVLQQVKIADADDTQPFEYILHRLNRIEDAIMTFRHRPIKDMDDARLLSKTVFAFKYNKQSRGCNKRILHNKLMNVIEIFFNVIVDNISIDYEKKLIVIELMVGDVTSIPDIYQYFYKVLEECGFEGASVALPHDFMV